MLTILELSLVFVPITPAYSHNIMLFSIYYSLVKTYLAVLYVAHNKLNNNITTKSYVRHSQSRSFLYLCEKPLISVPRHFPIQWSRNETA